MINSTTKKTTIKKSYGSVKNKSIYNFRVGSTPVRLVFSDKAKAPDIEALLVKIATKRMG